MRFHNSVANSLYNWQLKNQPNAIEAIYKGQLFAVGLFDCKVNSDVFHFWVENFLIPELSENSVMDNATFHKRSDIQEILEQQGPKILWLPPYSPDLNPIDERYIVQGGLRSRENVKNGWSIQLIFCFSYFLVFV